MVTTKWEGAQTRTSAFRHFSISASGFSLLELVIAMAILGALIMMFVSVQRDTLNLDRRLREPRVTAADLEPVLVRFGRDVLDSRGYYPNQRELDGFRQGPTTLLLRQHTAGPGTPDVVVWSLESDRVQRLSYTGERRLSQWAWRGPVQWQISPYEDEWVRLTASSRDTRLVDRIWRPRAH